jgi:tRNA-splicing ligase RtcB
MVRGEKMLNVISTEKKPVKLWVSDPDAKTVEQMTNLANLPFTFKHVAIMPDAHAGYGMPIGGVLATEHVSIPNAVGVDIGCGMCAVKTSHKEIEIETLKKIMQGIRDIVPVGFSHQSKKQDVSLMPSIPRFGLPTVIVRQYEAALSQLGTLGGGNHFIEIQKGSDGNIWVMIHSGSRNFGLKVAKHYNELAIEINKKWFSNVAVPEKWELAFLPLDSSEGQMYLGEMTYCVQFALANRKLMMDNILKVISANIGGNFEPMINIAHNYARMENHFGENVMVHRKGATSAGEGQIGIIPGSQGTKSYIVRGKGNVESFQSCSHGAGRRLGRKQAQRELNLVEEQKALNEKGIIHSVRQIEDLDEAPGAYKDIDVVMKNQEDLVDKVVELSPLAVVKG